MLMLAFPISVPQVQYLHPKDGVYPEKVNAGRQEVNVNKGRIGENPNPVQIKFGGKMVRRSSLSECIALANSRSGLSARECNALPLQTNQYASLTKSAVLAVRGPTTGKRRNSGGGPVSGHAAVAWPGITHCVSEKLAGGGAFEQPMKAPLHTRRAGWLLQRAFCQVSKLAIVGMLVEKNDSRSLMFFAN